MLSPSKNDLEPEGSRMVGNAMITRKSIMYIRRPKKSKETVWDQDDDEENNGRGEKILAKQREGKGKGGLGRRDGRSSS